MPASDSTSAFMAQLVEQMRSGPFVILSGAGLSTASGIPAYRDESGNWQHSQPIRHQAFIASEQIRRRYWARGHIGWPRVSGAQPNGGHIALAHMEAQGLIHGVITQNVDGLHSRAGSQRVIELHGGLAQVMCLACHVRWPREDVQSSMAQANPGFRERIAQLATHPTPDGDVQIEDAAYEGFVLPSCPSCGGILKPDGVFFGDNVPRQRLEAAMQWLEDATGLLIVGSSLMVYSGYRFAERADLLGKPIWAINQGKTRADALLDGKIEQPCANALTELTRLLSA